MHDTINNALEIFDKLESEAGSDEFIPSFKKKKDVA
jgi:hypothetical protein